jgi:hypothetical protein
MSSLRVVMIVMALVTYAIAAMAQQVDMVYVERDKHGDVVGVYRANHVGITEPYPLPTTDPKVASFLKDQFKPKK